MILIRSANPDKSQSLCLKADGAGELCPSYPGARLSLAPPPIQQPFRGEVPVDLDCQLFSSSLSCCPSSSSFFYCLFICERQRETEHKQGRGRERDGDTESEAGSGLRAVRTEPDTGLEPTNCEIVTRAEVGRSTDGATQGSPPGSL